MPALPCTANLGRPQSDTSGLNDQASALHDDGGHLQHTDLPARPWHNRQRIAACKSAETTAFCPGRNAP